VNWLVLLLRREWCQVLEGIFDALGVIEKNTVIARF
jgi:hypothetical protein